MKLLNYSIYSLLILFVLIGTACKEDPVTPVEDPVASFQFEISADNYLEVTFSNFSNNADTYAWDFGDSNTSSEENPVHTYAAPGDYDVQLTVTNAGGSHSSSKTVTIADPDSELKKITGETTKTWKLSRNLADEEYPFHVGPADRSQIWWAYGLNDPIGSRPCIMEEEYIFGVDGAYTYDSKGMVFADYGVWNADVEGQCVDENDASLMVGVNGDDLSAWGSGSFTFDFDASAATLTVSGLGAHIGLPKVGTNSEVGVPQEMVTYKVVMLETDGPVDKMVLETTIDGGYWQFFLVSYDDPNDEPELPGAPPTAAFSQVIDGSTVTFTNNSVNADTYAWDFGDGNMSTMENPVHTYMNDGSYTVTMTATNANGSTDATTGIVISTNSSFSAETFHGGGDKTWVLSPTAGALAVGPSIGSTEWFATSLDDVTMARACTFDDTYNFNMNGTFTYNTNGDVWTEPYMGVADAGCLSEDMLPADAAAWGSGMHTFTVTEAVGDDPAYITVSGTGAFIALPKAFNGGEYAAAPPTTDGSVRYQVVSYVDDGTTETLVIAVDISEGEVGGAYWTFTLVAQ